MKYRRKSTGDIYEPAVFDGKYRVTIELSSLEDFRMFSKIAFGERMRKVGETQSPPTINFSDFEEIS